MQGETRKFGIILAIIAVAVAYLLIALLGFLPITMSECIPRSDPLIHLCDIEKQREIGIYLALLVAMPLAAGISGFHRGSRTGLGVLIFSSPIPLIATITFGLIFGQWSS